MPPRGVLMTATARKRGSWKEEPETNVADSDDEPEDERKASQNEWLSLEQEARAEIQKKEMEKGIRPENAGYDDVASDWETDEDDDDDRSASAPSSPEAADSSAAATAGEAAAGGEATGELVPKGVTTAGDQAKEPKKRGGERKTGAERRKRKFVATGEDGEPVKKKKKEDDPDRWLKLRLHGEEKPKRIDATRVVHYHDFDSRAAARAAAAAAASSAGSSKVAADTSTPTPGSFRASVRRDMFDGSDDDEA